MPSITSANVACGVHAGDPSVARRTVRLALARGVAVGAHPGFDDRQGFGRRALDVSPAEVEDLVLYQVSALAGIVEAEGGTLQHVKAHGALYNMAARDDALAAAVARAVLSVNRHLILFGLSGSAVISAGQAEGLRVASEVFADRAYDARGALVSRTRPDGQARHRHRNIRRTGQPPGRHDLFARGHAGRGGARGAVAPRARGVRDHRDAGGRAVRTTSGRSTFLVLRSLDTPTPPGAA